MKCTNNFFCQMHKMWKLEGKNSARNFVVLTLGPFISNLVVLQLSQTLLTITTSISNQRYYTKNWTRGGAIEIKRKSFSSPFSHLNK